MKRSMMDKKVKNVFEKIEDFEWKHKNLIILLISILVAHFILSSQIVEDFFANAGAFGYLDSFIVGMLFPHGFTTIPATAAFIILSKTFNPVILALLGALGGVISDYLIFRFFGKRIISGFEEIISDISKKLKNDIEKFRKRIMRSKALHYIIPLFAGFIIASPLPDEMVAVLFGSVKFKTRTFLMFSFIFHFIGILILLLIGRAI
jgi:uncharacterized membrane protein YdjX (TVP38/TMEM64 family)